MTSVPTSYVIYISPLPRHSKSFQASHHALFSSLSHHLYRQTHAGIHVWNNSQHHSPARESHLTRTGRLHTTWTALADGRSTTHVTMRPNLTSLSKSFSNWTDLLSKYKIISLLLLLYDLPFNSGTLNNIRLSLPIMESSTVSQMILGLSFTSLHFSEISDYAATRPRPFLFLSC